MTLEPSEGLKELLGGQENVFLMTRDGQGGFWDHLGSFCDLQGVFPSIKRGFSDDERGLLTTLEPSEGHKGCF